MSPDGSAEPLSRRTLLTALGLLGLGLTPALVGCGKSASGAGSGRDGPIAVSHADRIDVALANAPDLTTVVAGMDAFAAHLHAVTASASTNFTVSPLSIAVAFGMLRAGSRGPTATQIDSVLGFPSSNRPEGSPHEALNALTAQLVTPPPPPSGQHADAPVVAIANGLFIARGFGRAVQRAFLDVLAQQYGAHPAAVDFTSPAAVATIDRWVTKQTHGRIKRLFDQLDPSTLMVLANAVYLKATWVSQFMPSMTTTGPFTSTSGSQVQARLMRQSVENAQYAENDRWQRITLPYVGRELTMRVVLPRTLAGDRRTLTSLLPVATAEVKDGVGWVDLTLPRWDTATNIDLLSPLAALGLTDLGDLTGIAPGLEVSQAVHRANITVDELGSEAAAVTGIAMDTAARIATPKTMRVDRPYVWAVVHEPTRAPVFVGHVVDPTR